MQNWIEVTEDIRPLLGTTFYTPHLTITRKYFGDTTVTKYNYIQKNPMKKVVHLTSVHSAFDTRIFHKECVSLSKAGYEVVLVTPHQKDETVTGVRLHSVKKLKGRWKRMSRTVLAVYFAAKNENGDLYHFHDPELIPIGLLLKLHGKKVIYDVHEDVSGQLLSKAWLPRVFRRSVSMIVAKIEKIASKWFDGIVVVTSYIGNKFPKEKTVLVQNFPVYGELLVEEAQPYLQRPPNLIYVGEITEIRGISEILHTINKLPASLGVKLLLVGKFNHASLEQFAFNHPAWNRVDFRRWVDRESLAIILGQARIGLVLFHPVPNHIRSQPNKLFEYMSAGLPIVASNFPLWGDIIDGSQCGMLVDPLNPDEIAKAIEWMFNNPDKAEEMGKRGKKAVQEKNNWGGEEKKLLDMYKMLLV